ncbi:hypothetical protein C5167_016820 [Papaver somniferum]|nr:hypothetical protein C5167_016820 [Papaver somniferum]
MWQREMECLLCISDHIFSTFMTQVMTCRPRSDIFINLPALCKMDNMLLVRLISLCYFLFRFRQEPFVETFYYLRQEILDSFRDTKF